MVSLCNRGKREERRTSTQRSKSGQVKRSVPGCFSAHLTWTECVMSAEHESHDAFMPDSSVGPADVDVVAPPPPAPPAPPVESEPGVSRGFCLRFVTVICRDWGARSSERVQVVCECNAATRDSGT